MEPVGVDNPGRIDSVVVPTDGGPVELVVAASGAWDGSDHRQLLLQEKLNTYLEHVIDGRLAAEHPGVEDRGWIVVVESVGPPDDRTEAYLRRADEVLRRDGGGVRLRRLPAQ